MSSRKKGDYCHRHRAMALPWIFHVMSKLWAALEVMWPYDLQTYVDAIDVSKPAIAILAAQLYEPIGVTAFLKALRGEMSPKALFRGLREAVSASAAARAEDKAEYWQVLGILAQGGIHLHLGVCAVAVRFGVLQPAPPRTKAADIIMLGSRDEGHASVCMHVCMYVCMQSTCMYVCIYVCMYVCM